MMQIGEKINKLTLVEYAGKNKYSQRIGLFRCDCGNTKEIIIFNVRNNRTKSCGKCNELKIGEKINKLTLVEYIGKHNPYHRTGLFKCDCGNTKEILMGNVLNGHTKSCGCFMRLKASNTQIRLLLSGKHNRRGKRGRFTSKKQCIHINYDSSYEEKALSIWETDSTISSFNRSKDRIPYVNPVDGSLHVYLPDFVINDTRMIEIKPKYQLTDPIVQAKAAAAEAYCSERGMTYEMWTEHELCLIK